MEHDQKVVIHDETYVSSEGIHINQVECLFSVVKPWLRKFRGLSKHGLEQTAHTFGIVRSLDHSGMMTVNGGYSPTDPESARTGSTLNPTALAG